MAEKTQRLPGKKWHVAVNHFTDLYIFTSDVVANFLLRPTGNPVDKPDDDTDIGFPVAAGDIYGRIKDGVVWVRLIDTATFRVDDAALFPDFIP